MGCHFIAVKSKQQPEKTARMLLITNFKLGMEILSRLAITPPLSKYQGEGTHRLHLPLNEVVSCESYME